MSNLKRVLDAGHFAFTGELGPPRGANVEHVRQKAKYLVGNVDMTNITDNQTAMVRMSSLAASVLAIREGMEPNYQLVCRDRNRIAMQSDILGAYALGVRNILCLSGDHQKFGDHPTSKGVFDIDSIQLIGMVKKMRDEGKFLGGADIDCPPTNLFIGAACNPFAKPYDWRPHRLAKKIEAGADFVQTQCIYNMERFRNFVKQAVDMGLTEKCYILAGVTPMKSVGMANYMATKVPGIEVPGEIIARLKGAQEKASSKGKDKKEVAKEVADEGIQIACEQIEEFKEMKGVAGVHLMAIEWEHKVPEITERAGMFPRPQIGRGVV